MAATSSDDTLRLYHCAGSRGLRALWAAEEASLSYELVLLPFPPRIRARDYLEINPLGTIPALVHGPLVMTESSAIAHYLVSRNGPSPLSIAPHEEDYGALLDFLHHADATLTFPQTVYLRFTRLEADRGLQEAGFAYADWFASRLKKVEARLATRDHLCGGRFTVADIAIAYALLLARRVGLGDRLSPVLSDYLDRLTARPGFLAAEARERAEMAST
ncbi:glutathione S-transferase family protein [Rhizorhabdus wittichii]|uniref:glutathione S-transferase family protein n=1 Tax=Rhizorhabdus wittichii TaxID=160791 RepID=UPI0002E33862|nr:glutathione S-transferase family protein [Rhizorhabdus wittichii]